VDIIAKIKKLLQLADTQRNSNIDEAAAAAAKAQKLMEKHRIHKTMLEETISTIAKPLEDGGKPENWKLYLASTLSKNNGCYIVKSDNYQKDNKIYIVGDDQDINSIQHLYTYIISELNRMCLLELLTFKTNFGIQPMPAFTNSFYLGAITIIDQRLHEATQQARNDELKKAFLPEKKNTLINALQKIDARADKAKQWVKENLKVDIINVSLTNSNIHGYQTGKKAAEKINLHPNQPKLE